MDANAACKVTAKHKQTGQVMQFAMSAGANIKLTEKIKQQTLFFEIISLGVSNLKFDNPSKYDLKWFQDSINVVLQKAKETINALLGQRGIKLPNLPGIDYSDIEESAKNGYVEVLVTPVIHLQQSDLDLDRAIRELPGR